MTLVRSSRWRRAMVVACLPYLLLSVFVDFIHLHPLLDGNAPQIFVSERVTAPSPRTSKLPDSSCPVCQWLRAGTGLQASVAAGPTTAPLAAALAPRPPATPRRPALLSPDFRGPPLPL